MTGSNDNRNLSMGLLVLGLATLPAMHVGNAALGYLTAISVALVVLRYGLLIAIGLLTRHIIVKAVTMTLASSFLVLDSLFVLDIFNVYEVVSPPSDEFIYFQF